MTAQEMYDELLQFVNKQKTATIYPDEFEILINKIQLTWVLNRISDDDVSQKRIEDLRILRVVDEFNNAGTNIPGGEVFAIPYDPNSNVVTPDNPGGNNGYLIAQAVEFKFQSLDPCVTGVTDYMPADPYIKGDQKYIVDNPFRKPIVNEPYFLERKNNIYVYGGDKAYAIKLRLSYYRYPRLISVLSIPNISCELPLHAHKEIVDMAVTSYLENIESPRYQSSIMQQASSIN